MKIIQISATGPRRCGIATFGDSLAAALNSVGHTVTIRAVLSDECLTSDESAIRRSDDIAQYVNLGKSLSCRDGEIAILQHEYGLFGGEYGSHLLSTMQHAEIPVALVLHTVLPHPDRRLRSVTSELCRLSQSVVVMSEAARSILVDAYEVPRMKIHVIPHGFTSGIVAARPMGMFAADLSAPVILSIGLISPNKGLELAIQAFSQWRAAVQRGTYYIVGVTHPGELVDGRDAYRESLLNVVDRNSTADSIVFVDQYMTTDEYVGWVQHADVVLMPSTDLRQVSSGTLAHVLGYGRPVICSAFAAAIEASRADAHVHIVDPLTADTLAGALAEVVPTPSPDAAPDRGSNGLHPDWAGVARMYDDVLTRMIELD